MVHCSLAHFPVRTLDISSHWQHVYDSMVARGTATPQLPRRIAADYQRSDGDWDGLHERDLVEDPVAVVDGRTRSLLRAGTAGREQVSVGHLG
jgi:hypothetical protein